MEAEVGEGESMYCTEELEGIRGRTLGRCRGAAEVCEWEEEAPETFLDELAIEGPDGTHGDIVAANSSNFVLPDGVRFLGVEDVEGAVEGSRGTLIGLEEDGVAHSLLFDEVEAEYGFDGYTRRNMIEVNEQMRRHDVEIQRVKACKATTNEWARKYEPYCTWSSGANHRLYSL